MQQDGVRGFLESLDGGTARGWAFDPRDLRTTVRLYAVIDGQEVGTVSCDRSRPDVVELGHPHGRVGFEFAVPPRYADGTKHEISFRLPTRDALPVLDPSRPDVFGDRVAFTIQPTFTRGYVDGLRSGRLRGWVVRQRFGDGRGTGGCQVRITANGREVATVRADRHRRDVAANLECDPNCGFEVPVPASFSRAREHTFRFHVVPDDVEIENSPLTTSLATDELVQRLSRVSDGMTALFRELADLRKQVDMLLPEPGWSLDDYGAWAREYYPALARRTAAERDAGAPAPLVSVVVPAYRPLLADFSAAVESVLAQTYDNWELIVTDDASRSRELTSTIEAFCRRDRRIRAVPRRNNGGISEATNTAIAAARGEWVALFDHDDLLVDVALEVMVRAAQRTRAELLYSDEDKVDQAGHFLEPNLKPDWNHRYMLGCNYACHLTMVRRSRLAEVGPLRTECNGAQDHDLLLRLAEVVPAERIHHVPEILYHWRMTPGSTAVDVGNKGYAREAGVRAVQEHLDRTGRPATVSAIDTQTIYRVRWRTKRRPTVCAIVPFRDQVDITRRCLQSLLQNSRNERLRVLLVDNWSTSEEAGTFVREAASLPGVDVLRVEEPFNYARLNNLAVARTDAEVLALVNNDLLVDPGWLRAALGELADPGVAAVGGRFRFPDGTVQHAGVVVGPRGIATHAHAGDRADDYGYIGRLKLSQEVTAVTAAGLVVRRKVYDGVGGMDETRFPVAYNDVDLCLRIRAAGHKIVYCAEFTAEHHESLSRGSDDRPEHEQRFFYEQEHMRERWAGHPLFERDPAYSRFFTVDGRPYHALNEPGDG